MQVAIVTLFPEIFGSFLELSFVGRAVTSGELAVHLEGNRGNRRQVSCGGLQFLQ